jgi:hypothetical protein
LGLACQSFKKAFNAALWRAVQGSRVRTECLKGTKPENVP